MCSLWEVDEDDDEEDDTGHEETEEDTGWLKQEILEWKLIIFTSTGS